MAKLLAAHKTTFVSLKKGEMAKGTITKLTPSEILIDTGTKTQALAIEKDKRMLNAVLSLFKVGDKVEATVINPESESGQPLVSLRHSLMDIAWKKFDELQKKREMLPVVVTDIIKGGFLVTTEWGVAGFLPQSQTTKQEEVVVGAELSLYILELSRLDNKIIFSQKHQISEDEFKGLVSSVGVGKKVKGIVMTITPVGMYVALDLPQKNIALDGFIHISEIAWERVENISDLFSVGQEVEAVVVKFDPETKKIQLSLKRLTKDPFEQLAEEFPADKKVTGTVASVDDSGVTVTLMTKGDKELEGFIKKEKIPPTMTYTVGQQVSLLVSELDKRRHRLVLVPVLVDKPIGYR